MAMIDIEKLSTKYNVRVLDESDEDAILALCRENTQFYEYCQAEPTREQILSDMHITPPGVDPSCKYYLGFYQEDILTAVMDLIDGYPDPGTCYIGFFMMNKSFQGKGTGTAVIQEAASYLKSIGKTAVRLGIDKNNPPAVHFWKKNGFAMIKEVDMGGWTALVAEKTL